MKAYQETIKNIKNYGSVKQVNAQNDKYNYNLVVRLALDSQRERETHREREMKDGKEQEKE